MSSDCEYSDSNCEYSDFDCEYLDFDSESSVEDIDNVFAEEDIETQDEGSAGNDGIKPGDFKVPTETHKVECGSLAQSAVKKLMKKDVEDIRGICGIDASTAGLLLRHMSWNKERLIEKYMDNANSMLVAAGVAVPEPEPEPQRPSRRPLRKPKSPTKSETRWRNVHALEELLVRHFVSCQAHLKPCPYPSCTNTVSYPAAASKMSLTTVVPIVSCGAHELASTSGSMMQSQELVKQATGKEHKFCFGCIIESDHRPVVCSVALLWLKKCREYGDSETQHWIKGNTKECPTPPFQCGVYQTLHIYIFETWIRMSTTCHLNVSETFTQKMFAQPLENVVATSNKGYS
ncbi:hypothetical protein B0H14DRAFT_2590815 [Mycena olivaceomarginata]|nr:hypothetical protein B0H14DRAFT_2590815 [Mycena olivaceomarginata]